MMSVIFELYTVIDMSALIESTISQFSVGCTYLNESNQFNYVLLQVVHKSVTMLGPARSGRLARRSVAAAALHFAAPNNPNKHRAVNDTRHFYRSSPPPPTMFY